MNAFQKHAISGLEAVVEAKTNKAQTWVKSHIFLSIVALILGVLTLRGVVGAIRTGEPLSVKRIIISAVGNGLETDAYGHTNILLIGVGGEGHDGANLTDTMIVASIDSADDTVSMLSIPRDIYVENEKVGWGTRINGIYEYVLDQNDDPIEAEAELEKEIEKILKVDIHYYAKIDFKGFTEIVDAMDGITVDVKDSIADLSYPADDGSATFYEPFYLSAGAQILDGETALKYARSRHTTSDFDRASRQQQVLSAIKEKALSLGMLSSPSKIKDLYFAIANNFQTNLSLSEILALAGEAKDIDLEGINSAVLNDLAYEMAGFLYTPPREEGDPFYLKPYAGDFSEVQTFAQLFFYHPEIYKAQIKIEVLNGTKEASLAGLTKMYLVRNGFNVVDFGNALNRETPDTIIFKVDEKNSLPNETLEILPSLTFGEIISQIPTEYSILNRPTTADIIIILGQDFADYYKENEEHFYEGLY
ncbi:MAG: LCP family protein [Candidatus Gracilibacteria bacterium]